MVDMKRSFFNILRLFYNNLEKKYFIYQGQRGKHEVKETKKRHSINSKKYTKERHILHKKIISIIENTGNSPKKGRKPIAILLGGGTASGKTNMRKKIIEKELISRKIYTTSIDIDKIKEHIPEYTVYKKTKPSQAASLVHKESYDIGALLLNKLIKGKKNFIYEGTMARTRKYKSLINKLKKHNYEIHAYLVDVPLSVAKERADKRARITGRKVPHHIIENTHKLVPRTFIAIKDLVDSYRVYDNQNGLILIVSNDFIDSKKYGDFLKKGGLNTIRK